MASKKLTNEEKAAFKKAIEELGPNDSDIEVTSFYGTKEATKEMEKTLRESRIKKIMKDTGSSRQQAIVIEAKEPQGE